jgi:prophage maintenance system killer protein
VRRPPRLVNAALVRAMHGALLARFGGLDGGCDEAKLESALARAAQRLAYGEPPPTLHELATIRLRTATNAWRWRPPTWCCG